MLAIDGPCPPIPLLRILVCLCHDVPRRVQCRCTREHPAARGALMTPQNPTLHNKKTPQGPERGSLAPPSACITNARQDAQTKICNNTASTHVTKAQGDTCAGKRRRAFAAILAKQQGLRYHVACAAVAGDQDVQPAGAAALANNGG